MSLLGAVYAIIYTHTENALMFIRSTFDLIITHWCSDFVVHLYVCAFLLFFQTVRTIRRRRCYPPTWKRWIFFLLPGTTIATSAVALYAFVETEENYFYIHSIWHMLIAGSVGFLLPPRAKPDAKVTPMRRQRGCGYQLCVNEHEEMGLVDPAIITINSICTS